MVRQPNGLPHDHYTAQITWRQIMTDEQLDPFKAEQRLKALDLFKRWDINDVEGCALLGKMAAEEYARFCSDGSVDLDDELMRRLTLLVLIAECLSRIFNEPQRRYRWMRAPNDIFDGKSAIDVMLSGQVADIERIHDYLKATVYC
jgi:hypothetical protein